MSLVAPVRENDGNAPARARPSYWLFVCCSLADGDVFAWGTNSVRQQAPGTRQQRRAPTQMPNSQRGELGLGDKIARSTPTLVRSTQVVRDGSIDAALLLFAGLFR